MSARGAREPSAIEALAFAEIDKRTAAADDDDDVRQGARERAMRVISAAKPTDLSGLVDASINDARNDERRRAGRDAPHVPLDKCVLVYDGPSPLDVAIAKEEAERNAMALASLSQLLSDVVRNDNMERGLEALRDDAHGGVARVAAKHGVSPSMVSRDRRKALARLRRGMRRLGFAA